MTKIKRLVAVALALLMILGSFSTVAFASNKTRGNGTTLSISTKIFRLVNGNWVETEKVKAGEEVMARVYVDTDYYTNSGNLLFFYNNTFFTDDFGSVQEQLDVNPEYKGGVFGISGNFVGSKSASTVEKLMVNAGKIDSAFAAENDFIFINYFFGSNYQNQKLDGSKWLFQIPLTIADNPSAEKGIFQAVEATALSSSFTMGKINVPRGEQDGTNKSNSSMDLWTATLNFSNQPVELYKNPVAVTFDANGGKFADADVSKYFEGDAGDEIAIEEPSRTNFKFVGWKESGADDSTASEIVAYPSQDTTYEAVWKSTTDSEETLGFRTEIYRQNENGEWVKTDRVKRGEEIKARVFIETSYYTHAGDVMFFYDKDFFEDDVNFNENNELTVNPAETAAHGTKATYVKLSNDNPRITRQIDKGYISQDLVDSSVIYTMNYKFNPSVGNVLDSTEWFAEFELTVREDAPGGEYGDFYISEDTVQNSVDRTQAYVNIPLSSEGGSLAASKAMYLWNVNVDIDSNPVTIDSMLTLDANGGLFADGTNKQIIEGFVGDAIDAGTIPSVSKDGAVFLGWVDATIANPTEADIIDIPAEIPHDDLVLNALWLNKVNITYVIGNGAADVVESVVPGDAFIAPEDPAHDEYTFVGWSTDGQTVTDLPAEYPAEPTTYYAVWVNKADITYKFNNGEEDLVEKVTAGDPLVAPADPAKEGYKFIGWSTDDKGATIIGLPATYPAEDTTYYAIYNPAEFVIQYYVINPDTGKFENVDEGLVTYGEPVISVPPAYEAPEGYTLTPAYTDVSLSQLLTDGATMPAEVLNLYYGLTANDYDAVFMVDGEEYARVTTAYGKEIKVPADPTKEGYVFKGWEPEVGFMETEGATFYAAWEKAEYTVTYIVDGEVYEEYEIAFGDEVDVPADPYKEGYTFEGWTPAVPSTMPAEDQEFKAVFKVNAHKATFLANGGKFADDTTSKVVDVDYGDAIKAPVAPTMEGYAFAGWTPSVPYAMPDKDLEFKATWAPVAGTSYIVETYTMKTDGTYGDPIVEIRSGATGGTATVETNPTDGFYVTDDSVTSAVITADGTTKLVVKYARYQYTVTFDPANGEEATADKYYYGATVTEPAKPKLEGYTFKEWKPLVFGTVTGDVTYVAQYEANEYTITFGNTGDTVIAPITQDFGTAIAKPADPEKEGYTFTGWDAEIPATMPAGDVTINATWKINSYNAEFYAELDATEAFETKAYDYLAPIDYIAGPSKTGYEFAGWSTDGENVIYDLGVMDAEGKKFYAVWEANGDTKYTVEHYYMTTDLTYNTAADRTDSFTATTDATVTATPDAAENFTVDTAESVLEGTVAGDGSTVLKVYYIREVNTLRVNIDGKVTDKEYPFDAPVDAIEEPTKEGYEFAGWVDGDGNKVDYPATMPGEDVSLNATWDAIAYEVTYIVDGKVYYGPKSVDFGTAIGEPSVPTKAGYTFNGWFDADGKKPADYGVMPAKNLEFTADWNANTGIAYVVEIYEMNTDGKTYPATATEKNILNDGVVGETVTIAPDAREGFVVDAEKSVLTDKIPESGTLVLKVYYIRNSFKLIVDVDGAVTETEYAYGADVAPVADPAKTGYTFAGWIDENGAETEVPAVMPNNDVKVIATWEVVKYDAVFNAGEGKFSDGKNEATVPVDYDSAITAPADEPKLEGYEFGGWATKDAPETPVTDFGKMDENGAEYVAIWNKVEYTLTFVDYEVPVNNPKVPAIENRVVVSERELKYGESISLLDVPEFPHHVFLGWTTVEFDKNFIVEDGMEMPADNLTLYACYERVQVMLIPKNDTCTTVIDRDGLTVDDYVDGESKWYVYGLVQMITTEELLGEYIDVSGDGKIVLEFEESQNAGYPGTGTLIKVYDNVTGEMVESFRIIIFGDLNGDAYINAVDVAMATDESIYVTSWSYAGSDDYLEYRVLAADVNEDGQIRATDVAIISDHSLLISIINQRLLVE